MRQYSVHDKMINEYEAVSEVRIGRRNCGTEIKFSPLPPCSPQIPHDLTWDQTRAAAIGSRQLTA
jgi:hypothetical protein